MNIKALSIVLVGGALALSSCSGGGSSTADNLKDAAPGDSLLYYFGQIQAAEYWRQAESDTTLRDEKSREDFMRGVKAGMDAVRSEDAYNQGVYLGVQMAMQIKESEEAYGIKCNKGVLLDAIKGGLANDSAVNIGEANMAFRGIIDNLEARKEAAPMRPSPPPSLISTGRRSTVRPIRTSPSERCSPARSPRLC